MRDYNTDRALVEAELKLQVTVEDSGCRVARPFCSVFSARRWRNLGRAFGRNGITQKASVDRHAQSKGYQREGWKLET